MSSFTPISLTNITPPTIVEALDFETILAAMVADLQARDPAFTALVESDPAFKILEVAAYREVILRQRVNDAAKGVMLAYATGSDLEHLGALFGVTRNLITPANPNANPPVVAVYETDASLRYRIQLSLEGFSTAGPEGAYKFHALKVATIKDVAVAGPPTVAAGNVRVTILSSVGDGAASPAEIAAVNTILNSEDVRPITDLVTVQSASIQNYKLNIVLYVYEDWDAGVAASQAEAAIRAYCESVHRVGNDVRLSGVYAAAHVGGVEHAELLSTGGAITADLSINSVQAPHLTSLVITTAIATP
jgi:phage-related baseplate assembly protein